MIRDLCSSNFVTSGPYVHCHAYPTCRTWSLDGRRIFFETDECGGQIRSVDIYTGDVQVLASGCSGFHGFDYSPEADCIVYIDDEGHGIRLVNLNSMQSGLILEEPEGTICGPPSISYDGTRIAWWVMFPSIENRFFDNYITAIMVIDVDPVDCKPASEPWIVEAYPRRKGKTWSNNRRDGVHVNHPQINPANKHHICYSHEMHGTTPDGSIAMHRLWQVMTDGSNNRTLVRQKAGLHFTHEVIAPDGKSLIFPYMHGVGQVDFDTFESRSLYYNPDCCPGHLTVSPDLKWIAGDTWGPQTDENGNPIQSIMMFEVESRKCAHLVWMPRSKGHPGHPHPNFSPDGNKIAYAHIVDGYIQVAYIDVTEVKANWNSVAQGVGEKASPDW